MKLGGKEIRNWRLEIRDYGNRKCAADSPLEKPVPIFREGRGV